jgi:drug/metabolite transporter (DMT)-like permease
LETIGEIQLLISVLFFAFSFVFQRQAMLNGMDPIVYNAYRYIVSSIVLFVMKFVFRWEAKNESESTKNSSDLSNQVERGLSLNLLFYGAVLGATNFGGSLFQQMGLVTVTAGKTGFITGMYVVFVPIFEHFLPFFHSALTVGSWIAALMSVIGLYLLSGCAEQETCFGGAIGEGEMLVFVSMLFWVVSIMASDIGSKKLEIISLQLVDFVITTIATTVLAVILVPHKFDYNDLVENWVYVVVVGFSEAFAFTLSTMGQIYSTPSRAALLYSLEAVVCAIFSYFCLREKLSIVEIIGAALMTIAAFVSSSSEIDEEHATEKVQDEEVGEHRISLTENSKHSLLKNVEKSYGSLEITRI